MARGIINPGEVGMHAVTDEGAHNNHFKREDMGFSGKFKDDTTGQILKDSLVAAARKTELE